MAHVLAHVWQEGDELNEERIKRTYRLTQEAADAIDAITKRDGISATEAVCRAVIEAAAGEQQAADGDAVTGASGTSDEAAEHIADLRAQVALLTEQMHIKDDQIQAAERHLDQAQALHAAAARQLREAQEPADAEAGRPKKKRGRLSRLMRRGSRNDEVD